MKYVPFSILKGKTISEIKGGEGGDYLKFYCTDGSCYEMIHRQDCCENVYIESIVGDLDDLIDSPIFMAEEVNSDDVPPMSPNEESYTWTFYKLATIKGYVDIRWYGSSNGYYSESVEFFEIKEAV